MASRTGVVRRTAENAWLITGPLAFLAVICSTFLGIAAPGPHGRWGIGLLLLVALVAAHLPVLSFVVRRQSFSATITEIPLVLALYYLPPLAVVLVATLAAFITQIRRRLGPAKFAFNVARSAAATSLAGLVLLALPPIRGVGPGTWGILFAAVSTVTLVTLAAVVGVITLLQGWQAGREVVKTSGVPLLAAAVNVTVGLIILIAVTTTHWSLLLLGALALTVAVVYRSYAQFLRQHRTLADIYDLTRAMTRSGHDGTLPDALLGRVRALMQAEYATLWLPRPGPASRGAAHRPGRRARACSTSPRLPAALRERAIAQRQTIAVGARLGRRPGAGRLLRAGGGEGRDHRSAPVRVRP